MRTPLAVVFVSAVLAAAGSPGAQAQSPTVVLDAQGVIVSNVTANGAVVVFGVAKQYEAHYLTRRLWRESLIDEDGDGIVTLPVLPAVPEQSVWVAVDLASGKSVMTAGSQAGEEVDAPGLAARRLAGAIVTFRDERQQVYALLVKTLPQPVAGPSVVPGAAWFLSAADGGEQDADGAKDGSVELSMVTGQALGTGTPAVVPSATALEDRIYVVDPDTLERYSFSLADVADIP